MKPLLCFYRNINNISIFIYVIIEICFYILPSFAIMTFTLTDVFQVSVGVTWMETSRVVNASGQVFVNKGIVSDILEDFGSK